jgi:hypothetical protein
MNSQHHHEELSGKQRKPSFWRTPGGQALAVFLAIVGILLILEHRAHLLEAWPLLFLFVCIGMHFFMHGSHGGHGGKGRDDDAR